MEWWWIAVAAVVLVALVAAGLVLRRARRQPTVAEAPRAPSSAGPGEAVRRGLLTTRRRLAAQLDAALGRAPAGVSMALAALEEVLITADVGVRTAGELRERVEARTASGAGRDDLRRILGEELRTILAGGGPRQPTTRPWVVLVAGVNGVGKTTTVGKLAARHAAGGRRVMLVAADTFRAAGIDQLQVWAERTGVEIVRQGPGADPSAVVFDAVRAAVARSIDVLIVDTAGRLHTRANLMEELKKVRRVISREVSDAPHETLLVLDATTGQNAVAQARTFVEAVSVSGLVLTKLDGTARGGVVIAVRRELGVPISYIGVGEGVEDLRPFDAAEFVSALLDPEKDAPGAV